MVWDWSGNLKASVSIGFYMCYKMRATDDDFGNIRIIWYSARASEQPNSFSRSLHKLLKVGCEANRRSGIEILGYSGTRKVYHSRQVGI